MNLGDLERQVMNVFWDDPEATFRVRDLQPRFTHHAYTTLMTVVSRLSEKGFLVVEREGRAFRYRARATREEYVTQVILEALDETTDREAALAHFARSLPAPERNFFRSLFAKKPGRA